MKARDWPNGRGWDVGQHEVIKTDGAHRVRLFRSKLDTEPYNVLTVAATEPIAAVTEARVIHRKLRKVER